MRSHCPSLRSKTLTDGNQQNIHVHSDIIPTYMLSVYVQNESDKKRSTSFSRQENVRKRYPLSKYCSATLILSVRFSQR